MCLAVQYHYEVDGGHGSHGAMKHYLWDAFGRAGVSVTPFRSLQGELAAKPEFTRTLRSVRMISLTSRMRRGDIMWRCLVARLNRTIFTFP